MCISRIFSTLTAAFFASFLLMGAAKAESPVFVSSAYGNIQYPLEYSYCSGCWGDGEKMVDKFTLDSAYTLTSTDFAISAWVGGQWNIQISIYDSNRTLLYSHLSAFGSYQATDTPTDPNDFILNDVMKIHADITPVTLGAGSYFIGWYDEHMAISAYGSSTPSLQRLDLNSPYPPRDVAAFQISGVSYVNAIPEPETYAMLLAGLGLVSAAARWRQARG